MTSENDPLTENEEVDIRSSGARIYGPWILAFLAVAVGLLSILALMRPDPPGESSAEVGFARDMAKHHSQASEMAEIVRRNTKDEGLYTVAWEIVWLQQLQIGQIRGWLATWDLPEESDVLPMTWMGEPTSGLMPGMASSAQISEMASLPQEEMEVEFLRLMIPHHQGGVLMAQEILERTNRPEVIKLAQEILAGQGPEIELMQDMLTWRGLSRMPDSLPMDGMATGDTPMQHDGSTMPSATGTMQHGSSTTSGSDLKPASVAGKAVRFAPWTLGVFALAWLVLRAPFWEQVREGFPNPIVQAFAVAAFLAAASIQAGFIVGQVPGYAAYAFVAAVAPATCAALLVASPSPRDSYLMSAFIGATLAALYAGLRLVVPLEPYVLEGSNLAGLVSSFFLLLGSGACVILWLRTEEVEFTDPDAEGGSS